jgi:hypothetical protein
MDKLLVALCVFLFGSASALAQAPTTTPNPSDDTPSFLTPGDYPTRFGDPGYDERKDAARAAAKAKWDKMTPEEKAAAKKAMAEKRRAELTKRERAEQKATQTAEKTQPEREPTK